MEGADRVRDEGGEEDFVHFHIDPAAKKMEEADRIAAIQPPGEEWTRADWKMSELRLRGLVPESGIIKLNLGAGEQRYKGYIGVDVRKTPACDIQHDLLEPLPLPDGCVSHIFCSHTLEHLPLSRAPVIVRDWHRVLTKGGLLWGYVPDGQTACALWLEALTNEDEHATKRLMDIILGGYATDPLAPREQSHCALYTDFILKGVLLAAGFQAVEVVREHPGKWDWRISFYAVKGVYPEQELPEPTIYRGDQVISGKEPPQEPSL